MKNQTYILLTIPEEYLKDTEGGVKARNYVNNPNYFVCKHNHMSLYSKRKKYGGN